VREEVNGAGGQRDFVRRGHNVAFERATEGDTKGILEYSDVPLVSQDIVGNPASCISDSQLTMSVGKTAKVLD
jgi:glyceraldehyde 3-phosphate dehydrogenase